MVDKIDPDAMRRIEQAVRELAEMDFPKVWVGEPGMTVEAALALQTINMDERRQAWEDATPEERAEVWTEIPEDTREGREEPPERWDELPEEVQEGLRGPLEIEPGEFVAIDDPEGKGVGIQMPRISSEWIDGLWLLKNMPEALDEYSQAELARGVRPIWAAKHGLVAVVRAWRLYFVPIDDISEVDKLVATGVTEDGMVLVPGTPVYDYVPLEDLTPADVDEQLLDDLEFHVSDGPETMGPYVIEDTPRAREAVTQRLGDWGA